MKNGITRSLWGLLITGISLQADDPIMNMMPRWDDGWGFQFIEEYRHESDLLLGDRKAYPNFVEDVHLLHFETVYTWDKSIRVTAKFPWVLDARREMPDGLGGKTPEVTRDRFSMAVSWIRLLKSSVALER